MDELANEVVDKGFYFVDRAAQALGAVEAFQNQERMMTRDPYEQAAANRFHLLWIAAPRARDVMQKQLVMPLAGMSKAQQRAHEVGAQHLSLTMGESRAWTVTLLFSD